MRHGRDSGPLAVVESSAGTIDPQEIVTLLNEEGLLELAPGTPADTDLFTAGLDSMAVMQLIVIVEERYGVIIGPEDTGRETLGTPRALADYIARKQA